MSDGAYDAVAVDLPGLLHSGLSQAIGRFPRLSSLVIRNADGATFCAPFTPADAACAALVVAHGLPQRGRSAPSIHLVDDSHSILYHDYLDYPEPETWPEDAGLDAVALDNYSGTVARFLERAWPDLDPAIRWHLDHRAREVATRIWNLIVKRRHTLFVCEQRLWWRVEQLLREGPPFTGAQLVMPWSPVTVALVQEHPLDYWSLGLLDDFPIVTAAFARTLAKNPLRPDFDQVAAFETQLWQSLTGATCLITSSRRVQVFLAYLKLRHLLRGRRVPRPVTEFYDAARACFGASEADLVMRRMLHYPGDETPANAAPLTVSPEGLRPLEEGFDIPDLLKRGGFVRGVMSAARWQSYLARVRVANRVARRIHEAELAVLGRQTGVTWETAADYRIDEQACAQARRLADEMRRGWRYQTRASSGSIEGGLDMKATIATMARGQPRIHVRRRRSGAVPITPLDFGTPVAFLFQEDLTGHREATIYDGNRAQRRIDLGESKGSFGPGESRPDHVYSVHMTFTRISYACRGHLERREVSSLIMLYTRYMGPQRYEAISARPARFSCRLRPSEDTELRSFDRSFRGIAWAIKYAEHAVIIVAPPGWRPVAAIDAYAHQRKVRLLVLPLSSFAPDFVQRMRVMHCISTSLKKHPERDEIVQRFMP